jgi:hypothetical protein
VHTLTAVFREISDEENEELRIRSRSERGLKGGEKGSESGPHSFRVEPKVTGGGIRASVYGCVALRIPKDNDAAVNTLPLTPGKLFDVEAGNLLGVHAEVLVSSRAAGE